MSDLPRLTRRERQVMDIVHSRGSATAVEVRERLPEPPTDAAVRSILRILVGKDQLRFEQQGPRYVYSPTAAPQRARRSALRHVLQTFFGGSVEGAMAALLEMEQGQLSGAERQRIRALIDRAAGEGR